MTPKRLTLLATSDIHGAFFPYDFIKGSRCGGSLARVHTLVSTTRSLLGNENVMLFDVGDMLLGSPCCTVANDECLGGAPHPVADIIRYMGYDAVVPGNHDIETGPGICRAIAAEISPAPVLCANAHAPAADSPFGTYSIFERDGVRIAVVGFVTAAITRWVEPELLSNLQFDDICDSARNLIAQIRRDEHPHLVVILLHSGAEGGGLSGMVENVAFDLAATVAGIDIIFFGHDHKQYAGYAVGPEGNAIALANPGSGAFGVARIDVDIAADGTVSAIPQVVDTSYMRPSSDYLTTFADFCRRVHIAVERPIAEVSDTYDSSTSLDPGGSAFMRLLHGLQLRITGAQGSIAAPTSLTSRFGPGVMTVADLYSLYRFDNKLCVVQLSGHELRRYMEFSIDQLVRRNAGENVPVYNIDSLAGIPHSIDMSAPYGSRVTFSPDFSDDDSYQVCMNTYRACGGGDHLVVGAGIPAHLLHSRITHTTDRNFRRIILDLLDPASR